MPGRRTRELAPMLQDIVLQPQRRKHLDRARVDAVRVAQLGPSWLRVDAEYGGVR